MKKSDVEKTIKTIKQNIHINHNKSLDLFLNLSVNIPYNNYNEILDLGKLLLNKLENNNKIKVYEKIGRINYTLNRFIRAETVFCNALHISRELAEENPEAYRPDVAMTLNNLGALYRAITRYGEAEKAYGEALEVYRELAEENPEAYRPDVAGILNNLGILYRAIARYGEAEKAYGEALEIRRELAEENPEAYVRNLLITKVNLGVLLINTNIEKGIEMLNETLLQRELLPDKGAYCYARLGKAYEELEKTKIAADYYLQAAVNYFTLTMKGAQNIGTVLANLSKTSELGENKTKGDAEILLTAIYTLADKETVIPEMPLTEIGEAIKAALHGTRIEFQPKNELHVMASFLIDALIQRSKRKNKN